MGAKTECRIETVKARRNNLKKGSFENLASKIENRKFGLIESIHENMTYATLHTSLRPNLLK